METHKPKVGVLALTLELYETLAPRLREGRERWLRECVLPALARHVDVLFDRAVFRREDIDAAVASLEAAGADALLVILLTYSPSQLALPALRRTRLPILLWNTQELVAVDAAFDTAAMIDNHGVHGTQDLANVLLRGGVPFEYVTSHLSDAGGLDALVDFAWAAAATRRLRTARLGLLGYPFPGMGDFAVDTTYLASTLGCDWVELTVEDYVLRAAAAPAKAVADLVTEYRTTYDVAPDLTAADLEATARVELALRGMVADHGIAGLSYQFLAFGADERTPTLPFVAASRLMADGIGFAGEGDIVGAAGVCLLGGLRPPASFVEMFTIDFAGNGVLLSHMGESNVAMAPRGAKVRLIGRSSPITRTRGRQLALVAGFEPGPATLCALAQGPQNRWRLVVAAARIADYGPLPGFEVPHAKVHPEGDVREFLTAYAKAGGPHHLALAFGDARPRLRQAARMLAADYCEV